MNFNENFHLMTELVQGEVITKWEQRAE